MSDNLLAGLVLIAGYHGVNLDSQMIKQRFCDENGNVGVTQCLLAAKKNALYARVVKKKIERLKYIQLPALILNKDKSFFILLRAEEDKFLIYDIENKNTKVIDKEKFCNIYTEELLMVSSPKSQGASML
ncbi:MULTISPECIES: cysteine peptidase family C39 domain-containing protein [Xenorhabdus]|uniref:cysteine peptidase family C39 domain-containing protein n=1 Tax=Xenorhabdus TaxID=626 RepID=UPI00064AB5BC|nr:MULTISPECIES: cysteine peptidase family C39 domain-containing protein [Xenorhabdus]KLU15942.1 hypothetical protein AAY47_08660 [Xenorhabdus griffiniae]KOP34097.1 hypothetical protein AFK69_06885 [Xenorhabdus sp. GDc328]